MPDILLPGPGGDYRLIPTLQLVADLENKGGSLFRVSERLLDRELGLSEVLGLLHVAYAAAGCHLSFNALGHFLMRECKRPPALILTDVLIDILTPLHAAEAVVAAGEERAAAP